MIIALWIILVVVTIVLICVYVKFREKNILFINNNDDKTDDKESLQELNDDLEQLLYIASHDLREPLVGVAGFISLVLKNYGDRLGDEAESFLKEALEASKLMEQKIDDILTLSRAGKHEIQSDPVSLKKAIDIGWTSLNGLKKEKKAKLEITGEDVVINSNRTMISQVFQNLIGNAIKYKHPDRDPVIKIGISRNKDLVTISVSDNGIGFDPNQSHRIFQAFQRLHSSESEYEGTGIGLAIVKKIVVKLGGQISANSIEGDGSTFTMVLPSVENVKGNPIN